tara:strand:+ start:408 stop:602 length:195 start_codon:yes stop_codon:yes gene_type:complete
MKGSSSMRKKYPTHIFLEEKKEIWALCTSSFSAMAISKKMKKSFPQYTLCLCNRETFLSKGGKV